MEATEKKVVMSFRIPAKVHARLKKESERQGKPMAALVARYVDACAYPPTGEKFKEGCAYCGYVSTDINGGWYCPGCGGC